VDDAGRQTGGEGYAEREKKIMVLLILRTRGGRGVLTPPKEISSTSTSHEPTSSKEDIGRRQQVRKY